MVDVKKFCLDDFISYTMITKRKNSCQIGVEKSLSFGFRNMLQSLETWNWFNEFHNNKDQCSQFFGSRCFITFVSSYLRSYAIFLRGIIDGFFYLMWLILLWNLYTGVLSCIFVELFPWRKLHNFMKIYLFD